jgi:DNA-binding transcriptional MerR regulator
MSSDPSITADLRIGDVASSTGVTVESLRYYEQRGLLKPAGRKPSGYRTYPKSAIPLVRFIKRAQALGFTLAEVEELVHLRERAWAGDAPLVLRVVAEQKLRDIDRRVRELETLRGALATLIDACDEACMPGPRPAKANLERGTSASRAAVVPLACPLIEAFDSDRSAELSALRSDVASETTSRSPEPRGFALPERDATKARTAPAGKRQPRRKR